MHMNYQFAAWQDNQLQNEMVNVFDIKKKKEDY